MNNLYLCSFASPDLNISKRRFINQSKEIDIYKETKVFNFQDLSEKKREQINKFFKEKKKRLFGYACWKPEIILNYLKDIPEDSILQYSDIGCHLNKNGINRLKDYLEITNNNDVLAFQYKKPNFRDYKDLNYQVYFEKEYTKNDLFNYFNISQNSSIRNSEQIWSGTIFFKKNSKTIDLLNDWIKICNISKLIDDSPSKEKNHFSFIEHRHDQSVFSILCKINNIACLSASECEWAEDKNGRFWGHLKDFPILAKRDKKLNFLRRFLSRQNKSLKRFFSK